MKTPPQTPSFAPPFPLPIYFVSRMGWRMAGIGPWEEMGQKTKDVKKIMWSVLFGDTYWAALCFSTASSVWDCKPKLWCWKCVSQTNFCSQDQGILYLANRITPRPIEHSGITMPVLSLGLSESTHYCLSWFSALLKCYISYKESNLENVS